MVYDHKHGPDDAQGEAPGGMRSSSEAQSGASHGGGSDLGPFQ